MTANSRAPWQLQDHDSWRTADHQDFQMLDAGEETKGECCLDPVSGPSVNEEYEYKMNNIILGA